MSESQKPVFEATRWSANRLRISLVMYLISRFYTSVAGYT